MDTEERIKGVEGRILEKEAIVTATCGWRLLHESLSRGCIDFIELIYLLWSVHCAVKRLRSMD